MGPSRARHFPRTPSPPAPADSPLVTSWPITFLSTLGSHRSAAGDVRSRVYTPAVSLHGRPADTPLDVQFTR